MGLYVSVNGYISVRFSGREILLVRGSQQELIRRTFLFRALCASPLLGLTAESVRGQIPVTLKPKTISGFEGYARKVETEQLDPQWHSERFLRLDGDAALRHRVLAGEISIREGVDDNPVDIADGLIHDWIGDVFFPRVSMRRVLDMLQDFDRHSSVYPEITSSRLLHRSGDAVSGYWRLEKKDQLIPVVLDVIDNAKYEQVSPGKWISHAYAKDIVEVENAGKPNEKKSRPGRGNGFLWRLYAYWSLKSIDGGVLGECRTLSLSRGIPAGLGWMIKPLIKSFPRESLTATLDETRKALGNPVGG